MPTAHRNLRIVPIVLFGVLCTRTNPLPRASTTFVAAVSTGATVVWSFDGFAFTMSWTTRNAAGLSQFEAAGTCSGQDSTFGQRLCKVTSTTELAAVFVGKEYYVTYEPGVVLIAHPVTTSYTPGQAGLESHFGYPYAAPCRTTQSTTLTYVEVGARGSSIDAFGRLKPAGATSNSFDITTDDFGVVVNGGTDGGAPTVDQLRMAATPGGGTATLDRVACANFVSWFAERQDPGDFWLGLIESPNAGVILSIVGLGGDAGVYGSSLIGVPAGREATIDDVSRKTFIGLGFMRESPWVIPFRMTVGDAGTVTAMLIPQMPNEGTGDAERIVPLSDPSVASLAGPAAIVDTDRIISGSLDSHDAVFAPLDVTDAGLTPPADIGGLFTFALSDGGAEFVRDPLIALAWKTSTGRIIMVASQLARNDGNESHCADPSDWQHFCLSEWFIAFSQD
ncbi:MAG: hypothetical protein HYY84_04515 [Deltaproteobacteria bacterium]|nr:hypothetical protein [Deltaproteobacteria bacterium]